MDTEVGEFLSLLTRFNPETGMQFKIKAQVPEI